MNPGRVVVAERWVWSHYPGMRAGRLYAGKSDLTKYPDGQTHLAAGPEAVVTLCGLPRTGLPHQFAVTTPLGVHATPCPDCRPEGWPARAAPGVDG
ncbi:MAG: hypothetical protein ABS81_06695 [Pseudonocardia sp. SCN 72-86]|nr:MAG: hypothetical protein ABS81_06695 [Pseudonocardia sp. SCN 72-86]